MTYSDVFTVYPLRAPGSELRSRVENLLSKCPVPEMQLMSDKVVSRIFVQGICDSSTSVIHVNHIIIFCIAWLYAIHSSDFVSIFVCLSQLNVARLFPRTLESSCPRTTLWITRTTMSAFITFKCRKGKASTLRQAASVWLKVTS